MGLAAYNSTFECGVWCQGDVRVAEHQPKMRFPGGARFSFSVPGETSENGPEIRGRLLGII